MNDDAAAVAGAAALDGGCRLIDTDENRENQRGVGEGIRHPSLEREGELMTTQFNRQWPRVQGMRETCPASLRRRRQGCFDLRLIHWPDPHQDRLVQACEGLFQLQQEALVRATGRSDVKSAHLQRRFDRGGQRGRAQTGASPPTSISGTLMWSPADCSTSV